MLVVADVADDAVTGARVGPEVLRLAPVVAADHRVGRGQDRLGGAVVLLEHDRARVGEVLLEVHDVADVGPAERIDRLVGVAHDHELGRRRTIGVGFKVGGAGLLHLLGAELVDQGVLRMVGVLVFIHQHVPEPAPPALPHRREGAEQVHGHHQQVVEVERVGLAETALVLGVRRGVGLLLAVLGVFGGVLVVLELVLGVADPVEDRARRVALHVEVEVAADQRHQPLGVGRVVDREARLVAEFVDLLAQDAHACRVEGADPHDLGAAADQLGDPLAHLGGGLVGEGDREDRAGVRVALGDQPRDPTGQDARLAGAGACDDEQRCPLVDDGLALGLVETLEQLLAGRPPASLLRRLPGTAVLRGRRLSGKAWKGELRAHLAQPYVRDRTVPTPNPPRLRTSSEVVATATKLYDVLARFPGHPPLAPVRIRVARQGVRAFWGEACGPRR